MTLQQNDDIYATYKDAAQELLETAKGANATTKSALKEKLLARGADQEDLALDARKARVETGENSLLVRACLEFSNYCRQTCSFCGMAAYNREIPRYRMSVDQIDAVVDSVTTLGVYNINLGSGEDWAFRADTLATVLRKASGRGMDITLVTSQRRTADDYKLWRDAGANRYVLKVETTDPKIVSEARPKTSLLTRVSHLLCLRDIGFKIGSGIICGLPNQTIDHLVDDLLFLKALKPDMASVSRFLPNNQSRYAQKSEGDHDTTLNFLSLMRTELSAPGLRIQASTTLGRRQSDSINHGANIVSLHVTPDEFAQLYSADRIKERHMTKIEAIRALSRETGLPLRNELKM